MLNKNDGYQPEKEQTSGKNKRKEKKMGSDSKIYFPFINTLITQAPIFITI